MKHDKNEEEGKRGGEAERRAVLKHDGRELRVEERRVRREGREERDDA